MLQQTRVDTVIPYYERFIERFPTVQALASADEQDVLKEWAGLGYYARARNLKRAAEQMVREHAGRVPRSGDALEALPGVGRYTAGAVRSIAFGERAAIVDGNVRRVLSRWTAHDDLDDARLWDLARELVPRGRPADFNQALMELGATVCTPRTPGCTRCPVNGLCEAAALERPLDFPAARPRKAPRAVRALSAIVRRRGRLLLVQRPSRGLLGGLWEVPSLEGDSIEALRSTIRERFGLRTSGATELGSLRHAFTHRILELSIWRFEPEPGRLRIKTGEHARFCDRAAIAELPLSTLMRKTLALAEADTR